MAVVAAGERRASAAALSLVATTRASVGAGPSAPADETVTMSAPGRLDASASLSVVARVVPSPITATRRALVWRRNDPMAWPEARARSVSRTAHSAVVTGQAGCR